MSCCNEYQVDWETLKRLGYMEKVRMTADYQGFKKGDIIADEVGDAQKRLLLELKAAEIVVKEEEDEESKKQPKKSSSTRRNGKEDGSDGGE